AVGEDLPAVVAPTAPGARRAVLGVDGHHGGLAAESVGAGADQVAVLDGGGVDADLVGPGAQQAARVLHLADAAADAQRHEATVGRPGDHVEDGAAAFVAGGDVEEHQL